MTELFKKKGLRGEFSLLLFTGILIAYTLRVNLSVAASDIVESQGWSEGQKGLLLSSFYWGYAVGQIPASRFIQLYTGKVVFAIGVVVPCFLSLLFPLAIEHSFVASLFLRGLIGLFESCCFPSCFHYFPIWIPLEEKNFLIPFISSGMYMGTIIAFSLSGIICETDFKVGNTQLGTWHGTFYLFALFGFIWLPFWWWRAYERPEDHPDMTKEELAIINKNKIQHTIKDHIAYEKITIAAESTTTSLLEDSFQNPIISGFDVENELPQRLNPNSYIPSAFNHNEVTLNNTEVLPPLKERMLSTDSHLSLREREVSIMDSKNEFDDIIAGTPWIHFFTNKHSLTLLLNSWVTGWIGFTLLSEMPTFLNDELGFDMQSASVLCVFPYLALFISANGFGGIFSYCQNKRGWHIGKVRKTAHVLAIIGTCSVLLLCAFIPNKYVAYLFVVITQFFNGASQCSIGCSYSDITPNYSGSLNAIGNAISAVAGIVGPLVVSALISGVGGIWAWRFVFIITYILGLIGLFYYFKYQKSTPVYEVNTPLAKKEL